MLSVCDKINNYSEKGCLKNINKLNNKLRGIRNRIEWNKAKINGYSPEGLEIKTTEYKGIGVFAKKDFKRGDVIEFCHCIALSLKSRLIVDSSIVQYYYALPPEDQYGHSGLIPLGFGGIYNTSDSMESANAKYAGNFKDKLIIYTARKDIKIGEEICVWHGDGYYNSWIKPKDSKRNAKIKPKNNKIKK